MVLKAKSTRRDNETKAKVLEDVSSEPSKRLNTEIPARLHKEVKTRAAQEDISITDIVIKALNEYLHQ